MRPDMQSSDQPVSAHGKRVQTLFDRHSATWQRKYRAGAPLHYRIEQFLSHIASVVPSGAHVLDYGCGTGDITAACSDAGYVVCGVDRSDKMIAAAKERFGGRLTFLEIPGSGTLPFSDHAFDCVIASSVFEYVPDLRSCLTALARVTSSNGLLFCTIPNPTHPIRRMEKLQKRLFTFLRPALFGKFKQRDEYLSLSVNRFSLDEWARILQSCGWSLEACEGQKQTLLFISAKRNS